MSDIVFCPPNVDCPCYTRLVDESKRLREANELMLTDIRRTDVDMLAFKARIAQLEAALQRIDRIEVYEADAAVVLWAKLGIMRDIARAALEASDDQ